MNTKFDYYDIFAVVIPGFAGLLWALYAASDFGKDWLSPLISLNLSSTLIFLFGCFLVGELAQSCGRWVQRVYWWFYGGLPSSWIAEEKKVSPLAQRLRAPYSNFIPQDQIDILKQALAPGDTPLTEEILGNHFTYIEATTYSISCNKAESTCYLAKSNMHRALCVIFIVMSMYYFLMLMGALFCNFFTPHAPSCIRYVLHLLICLFFCYLTAQRYRYLSIRYVRTLYAGFCKAWEQDKESICSRAMSTAKRQQNNSGSAA